MFGVALAALLVAVLALLVALVGTGTGLFALRRLSRSLDGVAEALRQWPEQTADLLARPPSAAPPSPVVVLPAVRPAPTPPSGGGPVPAVVQAVLGDSLIKAAALSYGIRETVRSRREPDALRAARKRRRARQRRAA